MHIELRTGAETAQKYKDPKEIWQRVHQLRGSECMTIKYIVNNNGDRMCEPCEQESAFTEKWESVYQIAPEDNVNFCHETERMVNEYLEEHQDKWKGYEEVDFNILDPRNTLIRPINIEDIRTAVQKMKARKAPGASKINRDIIINLPEKIIKNLIILHNASLSGGLFPDNFKEAIIKFIPKAGGGRTLPINYRPISQLENVTKIYERITERRLTFYCDLNNIHHPAQHCGRSGRGTQTALEVIYNTIADSQPERASCNVVLQDVTKAFGKVWHNGLKYKLCSLDIPNIFRATLCNFLDERTARIQVKEYIGPAFQLQSGVPQGSLLTSSLYTLLYE